MPRLVKYVQCYLRKLEFSVGNQMKRIQSLNVAYINLLYNILLYYLIFTSHSLFVWKQSDLAQLRNFLDQVPGSYQTLSTNNFFCCRCEEIRKCNGPTNWRLRRKTGESNIWIRHPLRDIILQWAPGLHEPIFVRLQHQILQSIFGYFGCAPVQFHRHPSYKNLHGMMRLKRRREILMLVAFFATFTSPVLISREGGGKAFKNGWWGWISSSRRF